MPLQLLQFQVARTPSLSTSVQRSRWSHVRGYDYNRVNARDVPHEAPNVSASVHDHTIHGSDRDFLPPATTYSLHKMRV